MIKKIYKQLLSEKQRNLIRTSMKRAVYPIYLGGKYHCNCCGKHFRKFLPKGNVNRMNAECPYCFSLERTRVLEFYLRNEFHLYEKTGIRVLHFAPEACLFKKMSALEIEYTDGDINPAYARNIIDITDTGLRDNYFDLILCSHVLGHVPDEEKAVREMYRVLKPGGTALVMTLVNFQSETTYEDKRIVSTEEKLKFYGEPDLCRLHGNDFGKRLRTGGFKVKDNDYREQLPAGYKERYCLGNGEREIIFCCEKQDLN